MMRFLRKDLLQVQKSRRRRRSGFRKATLVGVLAVSLTFAFSSRVSAQSSPGSSLPAARTYITELKGTVVSDAVATTPQTADENTIFFLYNESEINGGEVQGKFLNLGGYWGTHVTLSDVPYPFRLEKAGDGTYYIVSNKTVSNTSVGDNGIGSGDYVGWATNDNDPSISSYGVFASLSKPSSGDNSRFAWHFEKVEGSTDKYHIYLDLDNVNVPTVTKDAIPPTSDPFGSTTATISWGNLVSGKFYLEATTSENVYGDYNEDTKKYPTDPDNYAELDYEGKKIPIVQKYPGAEAVQDTKLGDNSKWKLISLAEYNQLFENSYQSMTDDDRAINFILSQNSDSYTTGQTDLKSPGINVSYLLHDPDFRFNDPELSSWQFDDGIKDNLYVGFDNYVKNAKDGAFSSSYSNESNLTNSQIANRARYMGAMVKEALSGSSKTGNVQGKLYQTIDITRPGFYTLTCKFTTNLVDDNGKTGSSYYVMYDNKTYETRNGIVAISSSSTKTYTWPYVEGDVLYNACIPSEIPSHNGIQGLNFYISPELLARNNGKVRVEYGALIDHKMETGNIEAKPYKFFAQENASTSTQASTNDVYTIVDNFQLFFRGQNTNKPDLILDEDNENLDYLEKSCDEFANLRLHRTFTSGNWNTIILPVGLTQEQYNKAFESEDGKNNGCQAVPLAELTGLTPSEIQFTTVQNSNKYEKDGVNDNTQYWLKPMTPYIIKANKANGGYNGTDKNYTETYHYWQEYVEDKKIDVATYYNYDVSIDGTQKPYFKIDGIKMVNGIIPTSPHTSKTVTDNGKTYTKDYKFQNKIAPMWNFKGLTATTNTKNSYGKEVKDECPYVVTTAQKESTKGSIAAFGTLVRNYTETTTTTDGKTTTTTSLISGRPSLKDSYIMSGGKLTYLSQGLKMKGFRCWFEYATKQSSTGGTSSAKPMLMLDGVNMTTGIDEIMANDEGTSLVNQYQEGIYSIGGQRISKDASSFDALPKGIYIVNGKKVIKD